MALLFRNHNPQHVDPFTRKYEQSRKLDKLQFEIVALGVKSREKIYEKLDSLGEG